MSTQSPDYHGYRFPPEIISYAVWLYNRFGLSFRNVEELLAHRGVTVSFRAPVVLKIRPLLCPAAAAPPKAMG